MECKKSIVPSTSRTPDYKNLNFVCPEDYEKCEYYNPKQPEESKCIKDSNIGYCVEAYFNDYDIACEGITEDGDIR